MSSTSRAAWRNANLEKDSRSGPFLRECANVVIASISMSSYTQELLIITAVKTALEAAMLLPCIWTTAHQEKREEIWEVMLCHQVQICKIKEVMMKCFLLEEIWEVMRCLLVVWEVMRCLLVVWEVMRCLWEVMRYLWEVMRCPLVIWEVMRCLWEVMRCLLVVKEKCLLEVKEKCLLVETMSIQDATLRDIKPQVENGLTHLEMLSAKMTASAMASELAAITSTVLILWLWFQILLLTKMPQLHRMRTHQSMSAWKPVIRSQEASTQMETARVTATVKDPGNAMKTCAETRNDCDDARKRPFVIHFTTIYA